MRLCSSVDMTPRRRTFAQVIEIVVQARGYPQIVGRTTTYFLAALPKREKTLTGGPPFTLRSIVGLDTIRSRLRSRQEDYVVESER